MSKQRTDIITVCYAICPTCRDVWGIQPFPICAASHDPVRCPYCARKGTVLIENSSHYVVEWDDEEASS